jgi:hypothetical protein
MDMSPILSAALEQDMYYDNDSSALEKNQNKDFDEDQESPDYDTKELTRQIKALVEYDEDFADMWRGYGKWMNFRDPKMVK